MAIVIVAGVLGLITISEGLFLRRLFSEIAELRRQITRFDRQMRAQRARVTFLRFLITEDGGGYGDGDEPPEEPAIVNGHSPGGYPDMPDGLKPVRRKRHLGLYIGGAVAAFATLGTAAREVVRASRSQVIGAVASATITAATVTMVTVQPWTATSTHPPAAAPTRSVPRNQPPPGPPRSRPPGAGVLSGDTAGPGDSPAPSASSSAAAPSPTAVGALVPVSDDSRTPGKLSPAGGSSPLGETPTAQEPPLPSPTSVLPSIPAPSPPATSADPASSAPATQPPDTLLCVAVAMAGRPGGRACVTG